MDTDIDMGERRYVPKFDLKGEEAPTMSTLAPTSTFELAGHLLCPLTPATTWHH